MYASEDWRRITLLLTPNYIYAFLWPRMCHCAYRHSNTLLSYNVFPLFFETKNTFIFSFLSYSNPFRNNMIHVSPAGYVNDRLTAGASPIYTRWVIMSKSEQDNSNPGRWQLDHHCGKGKEGILKHVYEANSSIISRRYQEGNVCSVYNFPLCDNFSISEIL